MSAELPAACQRLKLQGNEAFQARRFSAAIVAYTQALRTIPSAQHTKPFSVLYSYATAVLHTSIFSFHAGYCRNRAAAYERRAWPGDYALAIEDCRSAVTLSPKYFKPHMRWLQLLKAQKRWKKFLRKAEEISGRNVANLC